MDSLNFAWGFSCWPWTMVNQHWTTRFFKSFPTIFNLKQNDVNQNDTVDRSTWDVNKPFKYIGMNYLSSAAGLLSSTVWVESHVGPVDGEYMLTLFCSERLIVSFGTHVNQQCCKLTRRIALGFCHSCSSRSHDQLFKMFQGNPIKSYSYSLGWLVGFTGVKNLIYN